MEVPQPKQALSPTRINILKLVSRILVCCLLNYQLSLPLAMLVENSFGHNQSPVTECLTDHGGDTFIISCRFGGFDLVAKLTPEASFWTRNTQKTADLTGIVSTSSSAIEAAVPLEPTIGIDVRDPARTLVTVNRHENVRLAQATAYHPCLLTSHIPNDPPHFALNLLTC